jgi:adenine-specific DNA glycosylase
MPDIVPLRDDLMVQQQIDGAWQHMIGVIMLNQTGRTQVKKVLPKFLSRWPTPEKLLNARMEEIEDILKPLGMWRRRADTMRRMSLGFMTWDGEDAKQLHGIGRYGDESYRIFFKGERFEPQDKELRAYLGYPPIIRYNKKGDPIKDRLPNVGNGRKV